MSGSSTACSDSSHVRRKHPPNSSIAAPRVRERRSVANRCARPANREDHPFPHRRPSRRRLRTHRSFGGQVACAAPRLSVVVPVYHEVETLPACLSALAASDFERSNWELIVVSHTSAGDASVASARYADTIIRLPDRNWGAGYARNRGAE